MKKLNYIIWICASLGAALFSTSCGSDDNSLLPVKKGEYWGYVTPKGKYVVNPSLDEAYYLYDGRARVVKDGKVGYINAQGKYVVNPSYDQGTDFSEGRAFVVREGETPVCIDRSGKTVFVVDDWAEHIRNFHDGVCAVYSQDSCVLMNTKGDVVLSGGYRLILHLDGVTMFRDSINTYMFLDRDNKIRYRDDYTMVPVYNAVNQNSVLSDGLILMKGWDTKKYGYADIEGNVKIDFQFDEGFPFSEGLACVKTGSSYGYVDKAGRYEINPQFERAEPFHEGKAAVQQGNKWGFIEKKGTIVINPQYQSVSEFMGGHAFVIDEQGQVGIIDSKGKMVVAPQFDSYIRCRSNKWSEEVTTMKYTGEKFIPDFLKRYKDGLWDGMSSKTTLGEVRSKYKTAKADEGDTFICETTFEPVDDITLSSIRFAFDGKTYKMVDKYVDTWFFRYKAGKQRQYINTRKLIGLCYGFELSGTAPYKAYSIAKALADEIAAIQEAEVDVDHEGKKIALKKADEVYAALFWDVEGASIELILSMEQIN